MYPSDIPQDDEMYMTPDPPTYIMKCDTLKKKLTELIGKDTSISDMKVFHADFGSIIPVIGISLDNNTIVLNNNIYTETHTEYSSDTLTVTDLLNTISKIIRNRPQVSDMSVYHVEFGGLTPSVDIEVNSADNMIVIY